MSGALVMLMPFIWMLLTSFKAPDEIFSSELRFLPENWYILENYTEAVTRTPLLQFLLNGVIVTIAIFLCQIAVAVPAAYAMAKLRFRGRKLMFAAVLLCLLIPPHAVAIPWYLLMYQFGWLDTYMALVAPFSISVFGIFLMRQFFMTVPNDLIHAARMDGFSELAIVWRVMLPTAMPALVSFGIFSIVAHWNDYFWPLIVLNSPDYYTPPLGLVSFRNDDTGNDYGPLMAAATIVITPLVVAFLLAQKRFIEGITLSGMK
ncbi:carbohydrate ABC transporter permease [Marinobacterium sp. A346]|uniref:Carbohydrate ABC transporter permease n=2 Tax=Marinobacterium weihaiense TaxID=2851016 RepID=A0ABS6MEP6_9GAMM|nr:carbohydrate ABC transporter permease [Marinobacterium weihaiense]